MALWGRKGREGREDGWELRARYNYPCPPLDSSLSTTLSTLSPRTLHSC